MNMAVSTPGGGVRRAPRSPLSPPEKAASFSRCKKYRYTLWRDWRDLITPSGYVMFIGLNPSTADDFQDDATIRRCMVYAATWGYGAVCMTNAFAYRARDPEVMKKQSDPVGPDNNKHLIQIAKEASIIVAAWGIHGTFKNRGRELMEMIPGLHYLQLTEGGQPRHPLYLKKTLRPMPLQP